MIESTRTGTTRSSSFLTSIYDDNDYLELVWRNGQVVVQGGSSRPTQMNTPSRIGYSHGNSHQSSYQNSCQLDLQYSRSKSGCSYKLEDGCEISRPVTTGAAHELATSKLNCLPSDTFKKPRMDSSQTTASNSLIQDLGKVIDFSNALRPSVLAKSTYNVKSANEIKAMKVAEVAAGGAATSSKATGDSAVIDSSRGSHALIGPQGKNPLVSDASNPVSFVARSQEPLPCKQYEAVGHNSVLRTKRKADTNFCNEPLLQSSSVCSLGASNNPDICSRKQAGTYVSTRISDNAEDTEDALKEKDAREGNRVKRSRNAETHNLSERKRREKINKKMRVLKELIPNCNKVDKASLLDDAIEYLKTLKLQLQIMSMGTGLSMPLMMWPTGPLHHMINTTHLPQLMGAGMGFRPGGAGIPPCNLPQFSIPPQPGSITDNRVPMFGFPNQMLPMPMPHAPFIPMVGNPSTQPLQATCTATNLAENLASAHQLTTLEVSGPGNSL